MNDIFKKLFINRKKETQRNKSNLGPKADLSILSEASFKLT